MPHNDDTKSGAINGEDHSVIGSATSDAATASATATLPLMSTASSYSSATADAAIMRSDIVNHQNYVPFASVPYQSQAPQHNTKQPPPLAAAATAAAATAKLPAAPTATAKASAAARRAEEAAARYNEIMGLVSGDKLDQQQQQRLHLLLKQQRQHRPRPARRTNKAASLYTTNKKKSVVVPLVRPNVSDNVQNAPETFRMQNTTTETSAINSVTAGKASAAPMNGAIRKFNTQSTTLPPSLSSASSSSSPMSNLTPPKRPALVMNAIHQPLPLRTLDKSQSIIKIKTDNNDDDDDDNNNNKSCTFTTDNHNGANPNIREAPLAQSKPESNRQNGESVQALTEQERPPQQQKTTSSLTQVHTKGTDEPKHQRRRPGFGARTLEQLQDMTRLWYKQAFRQPQTRSTSSSTSSSSCRSAMGTSNKEKSSSTTTRMFTLYFNESSVQAMAYWANYYNLRNKSTDNNSMNGFSIPTVDVRYRLCGVCYLYGHYELECPALTPEMTLRFAKDLQSAIRTQQEQEVRKEHPQQQQLTRWRDSSTTEMRDNDAGTQKKYDVAVENCDGYWIEQRSESELNVTEMDDGVVIQAAASAEAFVGVCKTHDWKAEKTAPPHVTPRKLNRGDLVAWLLPLDPSNSSNSIENNAANAKLNDLADVCVGVVQDESPQTAKKILVKVVDTIPREQYSDSSKFPRDVGPPRDSSVWVERGAAHLVAEPTRLLQSRRSILLGKRKTGWLENKNGNPRAIKHRKDGTFARPVGRAPVGHRWDATRGMWVPETP